MPTEVAASSRRRRKAKHVALTAFAAVLAGGFVLPHEAAAAEAGTISTVAGNDDLGDFTGDGGPATQAALNTPNDVDLQADGGFLIADARNARVRRVSPDGAITTVAGNGDIGFSGDGGPATSAELIAPLGVAATADGGFLIADAGEARVRRVSPTGTITTVAGNGVPGFSGDGGAATAAQLFAPSGVAAMSDGGFLIADAGNMRVRRVFPNGTITTVAGTGTAGFSGDGGPATAAQLGLNSPYSVAVTADGGFVLGDINNARVRRVSPIGVITTIAGTGSRGTSGDGGPATAAQINTPFGVAVAADGSVLFADEYGHRVRRISPTGVITTVAGTGTPGFPANGDGGPATAANLIFPSSVAPTADGGFLFTESGNNRVRFVAGGATGAPPTDTPPATVPSAPTIGSPTAGNASATVRWNAPANNGGSAITGYLVRVVDGSGAQVGALRPAGSTATSLLVTGLTNGSSFRFQVAAQNAVGTGSNSALSTAVVPATAPNAPPIGTAVSGSTLDATVTATARWSAPTSNGGSAVTGYVVRALRISSTGTVVSTTTSAVQPAWAQQLTMTLQSGNYRFTVQAINGVGSSPQSARSNLVAAR
jgi:Fibronectin type III domain/NHL repeat